MSAVNPTPRPQNIQATRPQDKMAAVFVALKEGEDIDRPIEVAQESKKIQLIVKRQLSFWEKWKNWWKEGTWRPIRVEVLSGSTDTFEVVYLNVKEFCQGSRTAEEAFKKGHFSGPEEGEVLAHNTEIVRHVLGYSK